MKAALFPSYFVVWSKISGIRHIFNADIQTSQSLSSQMRADVTGYVVGVAEVWTAFTGCQRLEQPLLSRASGSSSQRQFLTFDPSSYIRFLVTNDQCVILQIVSKPKTSLSRIAAPQSLPSSPQSQFQSEVPVAATALSFWLSCFQAFPLSYEFLFWGPVPLDETSAPPKSLLFPFSEFLGFLQSGLLWGNWRELCVRLILL